MNTRFGKRTAHGMLAAVLMLMPNVSQSHSAANQAFDHYIQLTEARLAGETARGGAFLRVDSLASAERDAAYTALRGGELRIEPLATLDHGQAIACSGCMIHHWAGVVFIPGVTLDQVLRLMQDYDHQAEIYAPEVMRAKTQSHSGDEFHVLMRFRHTKIMTVVLDTEHEVRYERLDPARAASRGVSTRVQEVENPGMTNERDLPEGEDNGFLWRINSYWRYWERDGGVYVQCESVSLTRDIPVGLGWIAGPFVESVPRESLTFTLETTRKHFLAGQHTLEKR